MSGEPPLKIRRQEKGGRWYPEAYSDTNVYREEFNTYRPGVKVVDCTIRDGGLMNKWQFSDDFVSSVYRACVDAGIDYMEIGYLTSEKYFSRSEVGAWRFCADADLRRIVGKDHAATGLKLSAMADIGRIEPCDIPEKKDSLLDLVRVACYAHQIDEAIELANLCLSRGFEVSINLMAVAKVPMATIEGCLEKVKSCKCHYFYLADSFGSLYGEQVRLLIRKYREALPGKEIGLHGHNNQQLGFSNSVDAVIEGANMIDGSIMGLGRGAGNTPTETLLCFLRNPKFKPRPVFQVIQTHFHDLRKEVEWGVSIPYLIAGARNEHPKQAMEWEAKGGSTDGLGFYDLVSKPEKKPAEVPAGGDPDIPDKPDAPRVPNHDSEIYRREFHTYNPHISIVDNTIRDGGLMNNWKFDDDFVRSVYKACVASGIDYMDIGYFTSPGVFDESSVGPWRFCRDADIRRVVGPDHEKTQLKLAAMADIGRVTIADIPDRRDTLISMVRVACYVSQVDEAIALVNACKDKGFETGLLLMALSTVSVQEIESALDRIAPSRADTVYVTDSYGSLYGEQVENLTRLFHNKLPGKVIGFHGHNNMQMAFANTVQAICTLEGVVMVDGSILGLGRGGGNTTTENLLCFLKNPKFKLRPVLEVIQTHVQALQKEFEWGPSIPYLISGTRNDHPQKAMAWQQAGGKLDGVGFFDMITKTAPPRPKSVPKPTVGGRTAPEHTSNKRKRTCA
eukprot:TRINITY_DN32978_c0_g1_i1.p1 TRINITY_DN32978_c0_g1~~TRINITY_DN32978_c0_g1_i1.p1  ORF type:complete len:752 (+),score=239.41 TRINITY_DN32978_c0_g1_i1:58-2256(+)